MNLSDIAQIVGIIAFSIIIILKTIIAITIKKWKISIERKINVLTAIILWVMIYFIFLLILRVFAFFSIGTVEQLRIISGFATVIPLIAVIYQLYLEKKMDEEVINK